MLNAAIMLLIRPSSCPLKVLLKKSKQHACWHELVKNRLTLPPFQYLDHAKVESTTTLSTSFALTLQSHPKELKIFSILPAKSQNRYTMRMNGAPCQTHTLRCLKRVLCLSFGTFQAGCIGLYWAGYIGVKAPNESPRYQRVLC